MEPGVPRRCPWVRVFAPSARPRTRIPLGFGDVVGRSRCEAVGGGRINEVRGTRRSVAGEREPALAPFRSRMAGSELRSAPGTAPAMAVLAPYPADIGHVPAVAADRQAALARDFALLLRAHGSKAPPALLRPAGSCVRAGRPAHGFRTVGGAARRSAAAAVRFLGASTSRRVLLFVTGFHPGSASGLGAAVGGALAIRLFGLHTPLVFWFCNGVLPVCAFVLACV
jgi:hypothetical protein